MSTTVSPTVPYSQWSSDQLTVTVASFSSLVCFVVIVVLLSVLYRKEPLCCKDPSYQDSEDDLEAPPQYYSSRQTLVGPSCQNQTEESMHDNPSTQPGQLFFIGLPSSYRLPDLEEPLPHLPSYESVRKKDRQRQIHMMIADRFGLSGPVLAEPPPTYEESLRQAVDLPPDIAGSEDTLSPPYLYPPLEMDPSGEAAFPTLGPDP